MKKISDGQAGVVVKLERKINYQDGMKEVRAGFQGEVSRVLREYEKAWGSPWHPGAQQVLMEILQGQGRARAVCGREEGARAKLKRGAAGEVGGSGRGLGASRRGWGGAQLEAVC